MVKGLKSFAKDLQSETSSDDSPGYKAIQCQVGSKMSGIKAPSPKPSDKFGGSVLEGDFKQLDLNQIREFDMPAVIVMDQSFEGNENEQNMSLKTETINNDNIENSFSAQSSVYI